MALGPLHALGARTARGAPPPKVTGYGPLVDKGDLWLPSEFDYQIISRQGQTMSDGNPTPGIFDGMAAFPGPGGTTVLIRNHENRERVGEIPVVVPTNLAYDPETVGGNTKLVVRRDHQSNAYSVERQFAILGGTSTNCAGGVVDPHKWITCEEVVKRSANDKKHGYAFEIDARADGPVAAIPIPQAGRFSHEAAVWHGGILYQTEDRDIPEDGGACLYRFVPKNRPGANGNLAEIPGVLEALRVRGEPGADMDTGRVIGRPYPVDWVVIDEPDHDDDTDQRQDRVPGFTPTRFQAQDKGAARFDREEGMWIGNGKVFFDCTTGGAQDLGQVWEYDPGRETITLIYESTNSATLENPDNVVIVPSTGDIFLQEDSDGDQFVRGLTQGGGIYDFAKSAANETEFCGGCFDPDGQTLYLNQQGERGSIPDGPPDGGAVTYAIFGPFQKRGGNNGRSLRSAS